MIIGFGSHILKNKQVKIANHSFFVSGVIQKGDRLCTHSHLELAVQSHSERYLWSEYKASLHTLNHSFAVYSKKRPISLQTPLILHET